MHNVEQKRPVKNLPKTVDEAVKKLISDLPLKDKTAIANLDENDLATLQFSLGTYIGREFGIWSDNRELLDSCEFVSGGTLEGDGPGNSANGRLNALRNMLEMAGDLIGIDDIEGACVQLHAALGKCDGDSPPPDFVAGLAASELYTMITELMAELGCE